MVGAAMTIDRERLRMIRALGMRVLVARGRRVSLLPVRGRSLGLLVHEGSRVAVIRAKDRSGLPLRQGRWCVSIDSSLDI